jgi:hypothetical protein
MDFVTTLKHMRCDFGIANLNSSLDVEKKARVKDARGKKVEGVEYVANSITHYKCPN